MSEPPERVTLRQCLCCTPPAMFSGVTSHLGRTTEPVDYIRADVHERVVADLRAVDEDRARLVDEATALRAQLAAVTADAERLKGLLDVYQSDCNALREARRLGR